MKDALAISPLPPGSPGLDFEGLKARGIALLQALAGEEWTDYNEHDPGVTTLEQLCFALTELTYRAELPIAALLAPAGRGIDPQRAALFTADVILPSPPVTALDDRRLLVDRVPGLANAWFTPARGGAAHSREIELYVPGAADQAARAQAARRARRIYVRHRRFCEDLVNVHVVKPLPVTLAGSVFVEPGSAPESVLARIFYAVGRFLAPEVRRQPAAQRLANGIPASEVFSGPRLRDGLIDDEDLQQPPSQVSIADLVRVIATVPGVTGVRDVDFRTDAARIGVNAGTVLHVPRRRILQLETAPEGSGFRLRLFANGTEYTPHPILVQSELQQLWMEHRRRYPLAATAPPAPAIQPAAAGIYHSIQHHFPAAYGINAFGLDADASELRRAQARQFKGYLLVFEQLLANAFARVAAMHEVWSVGRGLHATPAYPIDESVPDAAPLLKPDYRRRLRDESRAGDRALERRSRVLDAMLAAYGEALTTLPLPTQTYRRGSAALLRADIRAKRALLRRLPRLGARGGCGIDYLRPSGRGGDSSVEVRGRIELGMMPAARPLAEVLTGAGVRLTGSAPPDERAAMLRHARTIDAAFETIPHVPANPSFDAGGRELSDDLLLAAGELGHYRIGVLDGDTAVTVVCRAPGQPLWQFVGRYADRKEALADVAGLLRTVRRLEPHLRRLTVIEHPLLRFGRRGDAHPGDLAQAFSATAVVSLPAREAADRPFRDNVRRVLHAHTPAHIVLDVRFLRLSHADAFETLHGEWRQALRRRGRPLIDACRRMREFLHAAAD